MSGNRNGPAPFTNVVHGVEPKGLAVQRREHLVGVEWEPPDGVDIVRGDPHSFAADDDRATAR